MIVYNKNDDVERLLKREEKSEDLYKRVREILETVKKDGDTALKAYTKAFDGADLAELRVSGEEIEEAMGQIDPELPEIYARAAENIRKYHENQKIEDFIVEDENGVRLGQIVRPLKRVGLYVPGGKASYPSTVLMDSIPARVAGVDEIVMVTPPGKDGKIDPHILAAAKVAGIDEIYKVGGAQAVGALAFGTESIAPVDKIVGPGNAYVAEAKRQVFGTVDIDMIAGPSEVCVIADDSARPDYVAADLLSQAEHDEQAMTVLITPDEKTLKAVEDEITRQLKEDIARKNIAESSVNDHHFAFLVKDLNEAFELANRVAPEHLELEIKDPQKHLGKVKNAGAVFLGAYTPEPVGDYYAGPNHTLPTSGTARFSSPLSVYDFLKRSSLIAYTKEALDKNAEDIVRFARSEGLDAHAASIEIRENDEL